MKTSTTLSQPLARLRQFARERPQSLEQCELCSVPIAAQHIHLIDPESRRLICSCHACALLFPNQTGSKYRRVPRDTRQLDDFQLTDAQWNQLLVPIGMAFFFHSSHANRVVALYPSPAGATESLLELDAWESIVQENPVLETMQADVESLLVNRLDHESPGQYYLAPIDKCYELVGLIRAHWRGMSGGTEVWREVGSFFQQLQRANQ